MNPVLLREGTRGCSLLVATTKPGKQRQRGQEAQAEPNWAGVGQQEVNDKQLGEWSIRRGRVEVANGVDKDAEDERSPDEEQYTPQPTAGPYLPGYRHRGSWRGCLRECLLL